MRTLVVDECDMLLDGGYKRQLDNVLTGVKRVSKLKEKWDDDNVRPPQLVWVGATMPDVGTKR